MAVSGADPISAAHVEAGQRASLAELLRVVAEDARRLFGEHFALLKVELGENVATASRLAAFVAAGGVLAFAGLLALIAFMVIGLDALGLQLWAASLIVTLFVLLLAGGLAWYGIRGLRQISLYPSKSAEAAQETLSWIQARGR
jgi:uncharacterized membrane protein YqjE